MKKNKQQPTTNQVAKLSTRKQVKAGTFSDHITELRRRLMLIALAFVGASALTYTYHEALVRIIMSPLKGEKLVYLTPGGGFSFIFQVSIYAGLIISAPVIIYHLYAFIHPALPKQAQRSAFKIVLSALALIIMGISYGYFVAVPAALKFLSGFAGDSVTPNLTADSYLSFFLSYIAGLALLSLLPLLLMFTHWVKPLTPGGLLKSERWIILFAFVVAAIITPTPDAANQTMIAGPVILLYQFGVGAVMVSIARHKRAIRKAARSIIEMETDETKLNELVAEWSTVVAEPLPALLPQAAQPIATFETLQQPTIQQLPASPHTPTPPSATTRATMDIIGRSKPLDPIKRSVVTPRTEGYTPQRPVQSARRKPQLSMEGIFAPMSANNVLTTT